jgi:probable HAF family extracellular repeat protein
MKTPGKFKTKMRCPMENRSNVNVGEGRRLGLMLIAVAFLALVPLLADAQTTYAITDLGTLGGTFSVAGYVNANGAVGGASTLAGDTVVHAFLWENGVMTDLGPGINGPNSAGGINNASEVSSGEAQYSSTAASGAEMLFCASDSPFVPFVCHAATWTGSGVLTDLGTLGGPGSAALFINDSGQVVGVSETRTIDPFGFFPAGTGGGFPAIRGFVLENGKMKQLSTLGGYDSLANANNNVGQVGGTAQLAGGIDPTVGFVPQHPVTWTNGAILDLGTLGGKFGFVESMNSVGQVAGITTLAGEEHVHGFLWQNGVMTDVGTLPGDTDSDVSQINNLGEGVGFSGNSTSMRATILQNGVMTDLNTLVPANSGYQLLGSTGNNNVGQIVVLAVVVATGETHAVLLTPSNNSSRGNAGGALLTPSLRAQLKKRIGWARLKFLN